MFYYVTYLGSMFYEVTSRGSLVYDLLCDLLWLCLRGGSVFYYVDSVKGTRLCSEM